MPNKRRHISSVSKAVLARKILSKIEDENDPALNVVRKAITLSEETLSEDTSMKSLDSPKQQETSINTESGACKTCNCKKS